MNWGGRSINSRVLDGVLARVRCRKNSLCMDPVPGEVNGEDLGYLGCGLGLQRAPGAPPNGACLQSKIIR